MSDPLDPTTPEPTDPTEPVEPIPDPEPEPELQVRDSILLLIKKKLGIAPDYHAFDEDIITDINTVFLSLSQLGVGPKKGFSITDEKDLWTDFLGDATNLEAVKSYIYMRVRLMFDPPTNSFVITSLEKQIAELEWRLNVEVETKLPDEDEEIQNGGEDDNTETT